MSNVGRPGNGRPRCAKTPATAAERRARLLHLVSSLRPKEGGRPGSRRDSNRKRREERPCWTATGGRRSELRRTSAVMIERDRPYCQIVDGHRLPGSFSEEVYRSGLRYRPEPGDVVLDTFPKCGTHWVLGILKAAYKVCRGITPGSAFLEKLGLEAIEKCAKPRIVFTHLPFQLVPFSDAAKYIYVIRNPKDCCVSFYHHTKNIPVYNFQDGTFDEYFEIFLDGRTDFGSYYESLRSWYARRNEPNVLFLTYEGMHADVRGSVLEITRFVDSTIADDLAQDEDKMKTVLENSSVGSMKKQFEVQFVRKGVVGDWRNYFSPEQSRRLEERFFREMEGTDVAKLWDAGDWQQDRAKS